MQRAFFCIFRGQSRPPFSGWRCKNSLIICTFFFFNNLLFFEWQKICFFFASEWKFRSIYIPWSYGSLFDVQNRKKRYRVSKKTIPWPYNRSVEEAAVPHDSEVPLDPEVFVQSEPLVPVMRKRYRRGFRAVANSLSSFCTFARFSGLENVLFIDSLCHKYWSILQALRNYFCFLDILHKRTRRTLIFLGRMPNVGNILDMVQRPFPPCKQLKSTKFHFQDQTMDYIFFFFL